MATRRADPISERVTSFGDAPRLAAASNGRSRSEARFVVEGERLTFIRNVTVIRGGVHVGAPSGVIAADGKASSAAIAGATMSPSVRTGPLPNAVKRSLAKRVRVASS
jgi:hypothetical protein